MSILGLGHSIFFRKKLLLSTLKLTFIGLIFSLCDGVYTEGASLPLSRGLMYAMPPVRHIGGLRASLMSPVRRVECNFSKRAGRKCNPIFPLTQKKVKDMRVYAAGDLLDTNSWPDFVLERKLNAEAAIEKEVAKIVRKVADERELGIRVPL